MQIKRTTEYDAIIYKLSISINWNTFIDIYFFNSYYSINWMEWWETIIESIVLHTYKVVPNSFLSSVLPEFPRIFPRVPGNIT